MKCFLGVDPGVTGALALLDEHGKLLSIWDMPTMPWGAGGKKRTVDATALSSIFYHLPCSREDVHVFVERVSAMPNPKTGTGMGATSAFNFGMGFGVLLAAIRIHFGEPTLVVPTVWKRHHNLLKTEKDASRVMAQEKFPTASLARKKDIGRADSLMIAAYGWSREGTLYED